MAILDILRAAQNGGAIANLARTFTIDEGGAEAAVAAIVPELVRALERNTLSRGGLADLVRALGGGTHERYLGGDQALGSPELTADGNAILGHILGSKHDSRGLAQRVARATGIDQTVVKAMLPVVAALLMGGLERASRKAIADVSSKVHGLGARSGGAMPTQRPLPIPGDDRPGRGGDGGTSYDDLSDIVRRGRRSAPGGGKGAADGSVLGNVIREIIGGVLGFESKGIIGWLVRLIVIRWGWGILKAVLRRLFVGR